jgi:hypothetical protein
LETAISVPQSVLTIKEVIGQIHARRCLLPVPQEGELISSPEQITRLFDLLMQGRSIGQLILWSIGRNRLGKYHFSDFLGNGNEKLSPLGSQQSDSEQEDLTVVIDGKRRLASLYVGLLGLQKNSPSCGNQETDDFLHSRALYLNISSRVEQSEHCYDFRFLTESERSSQGERMAWFRVGEVLNLAKPQEIDSYVLEKGLKNSNFCRECLVRLQNVIDEKRSVSCVVEKDEEVGKVLLMFL